mgnify:CR=1 FL=1|jgi:FkbH-like protein
MFQYEWGQNKSLEIEQLFHSSIVFDQSSERMLSSWEEHCLECSPPLCYKSCTKFLQRPDSKCRNFETGISKVNNVPSFYKDAVYIKFRDWAKLETKCTNVFNSARKDKFYDNVNGLIIRFIASIYSLLPLNFKRKRKINGLYYLIRDWFIFRGKHDEVTNVELIGHIYLLGDKKTTIRIETTNQINKIVLEPGSNKISWKFLSHNGHLLKIFPENDINAELIIQDLAIVKQPNQLVKCVIWDLDNTLWEGVLLEGEIKPRDEIISTIKELDSHGILNSISSKNNYEEAKVKLESLGIWEYFIFPKINWSPKSLNIQETIKQMNIGEDSIIFIDDNLFEREEVQSKLKLLRVYDQNFFPSNLIGILDKIEVTQESKNRRRSYQIENLRQIEQSSFGTDYLSFLLSCELKMTIEKPTEMTQKTRAKELLNRTNQLNLSTKRYSDDEFEEMINSDDYKHYIFSVSDKYGDYGIVGFINLKISNFIEIIDFVISCRVVQKMVEKSVIDYIIKQHAFSNDIHFIQAYYKPTLKNGPMFNTLQDLGFELESGIMKLPIDKFDAAFLPVSLVE